VPLQEKVDKPAAAIAEIGTPAVDAEPGAIPYGLGLILASGRQVGTASADGPPSTDGGRCRTRQRLTPNSVLALQRSAGNRSVAALVQRCGCSSCACRAEEHDGSTQDAPTVQRLGLTDVAGAVLPQWVTDLVEGVPAKARSLAGLVTGGTAGMERDVAGADAQAATKLDADATRTARAAAGTAEADASQAESTATTTRQQTEQEAARGGAAASSLPSAGSLAGPLLNPALPTIDMERVRQVAARVGELVQAIPGGAEQLRTDIEQAVATGTAADGQPGWNCDQAEVMSMVGGVGRAIANAGVRAGKAVLGEDRYNRLVTFVNEQIAAVQRTVAAIRAGLDKVVAAISKEWDRLTKPLVEGVERVMAELSKRWEKLTKDVNEFIDKAIAGAKIVWEGIDKHVIQPFVRKVEAAKTSIDSAVQGAISTLGSWWENLPRPVKGLILGAAAVVAGPVGLALAAAYKAAQLLVANKDRIFAKIRALADRAASALGGWYQKARKVVERAIDWVRERGRKLVDLARKAAAKAAALVDQNTPKWVKDLRAGLERLRRKIGGEVCTALGETAGPCAEQFVPDVGPNAVDGASHDVTVQATGEIAAVVEGVPVKVAGGASVALSRKGKVYTVVVAGEGAVAVTTPPAGGGGGSEAKVEVELPGALGDAQKAWKGITGKAAPTPAPAGAVPGGAPGTPAVAPPGTAPPAGQTAPGAPGAAAPQKGPQASAEAGYKAKVEMTYVFDGSKEGADSTCDGVGGMTAMLAGLGVGALLPPPFNALGGGVQGDYSNHLTACSVTLSEYGNVKVDVKSEGVGGIEAAVSAEVGVTVGRERAVDKEGKISDEWVDKATVFGSISGSLAASLLLRADPKISLGGKATASGRLSASLEYNEKQGKITAMSVTGSASFGFTPSLPGIRDILPEPIATAVNRALEPYLDVATGTVEATATLSFNNLHILLGALDTYVASNGERCTAQGVIDVVTDHFSKEGNLTTSLSVVLKISKSLAKVSAEAGGKEASGKAEITVTENQTIPLYPVAAPLPLPQSTPATPAAAAPAVGRSKLGSRPPGRQVTW
jgi:hypothetical protein